VPHEHLRSRDGCAVLDDLPQTPPLHEKVCTRLQQLRARSLDARQSFARRSANWAWALT